jgi:hypothetical protein
MKTFGSELKITNSGRIPRYNGIIHDAIRDRTLIMPRYFFHIRQGSLWLEDYEGTELADLPAAMLDATASAREIVGNRLQQGLTINNQTFEISDAGGTVLAKLAFSDVYKA